jgi:hypothetical protein
VAAIGLKCALGHGIALLFPVENLRLDGKTQVYRRLSQESSGARRKGENRLPPAHRRGRAIKREKYPCAELSAVTLVTFQASFTINGATHPEWTKVM